MNLLHTSYAIFLRSVLILSVHLRVGLKSDPLRLTGQNLVCALHDVTSH